MFELGITFYFMSTGHFPFFKSIYNPFALTLPHYYYRLRRPHMATPESFGPKFAALISQMLNHDRDSRIDIKKVI